jgi:mannitol-1-phosphate 5-dehydrogenase
MTEHQKRILIWGAGRIGRGFVGEIFASSGYELVFVDQAKSLVDKLNEQEFFTVVKALNENDVSYLKIENFTALHTSQEFEIQRFINNIDTIAISTFPKDFESVASALQKLIINRITVRPNTPIDILLCTNLVHAGPLFQQYLYKNLEKSYQEYFSKNVGIVESLVIRIAPPAPQEEIEKDPLVVWTNGYSEFPVDKNGFKGTPPTIPNFRFVQDMRAEEKRKIYTYNMSHAILGYYGYQLGYDLLVESLTDSFIRGEVIGALDEVSKALQVEYGFSKTEMDNWIESVISHTNNPTIGDSVLRMAADPIRKLKKDDRLVGPALLCLKNGIEPNHIIKGIAAAFHYENESDPTSNLLSTKIKNLGIKGSIQEICELGDTDLEQLLVDKIENAYHQFQLELMWHQKALQAYQLGFKYEKVYHGCGQCVYAAVAEILNIFDPQVFNAATGLCGGIGLMNDSTCSALTGGVLAIGQLFPRRRENFSGDKESKYTNFYLVQKLREKFENEFGTIKCAEVHRKKFGRSFDLQLKEERDAFEEAGGHSERGCTDTVGKAAQFTIEVITPLMIQIEMEKDGKRSKILED